ncbi:MAG: hypothetical protein FH749_07210 [Firmicutes bacterium]|nr:hypothetical protein [Bacillota bacterium]
MSFFKKLGFRRSDELDLHIAFLSMRVAWVFTTIALLAWTLQEVISTGQFGVQGIIFFLSQTVFWSSNLYYTKKFSADGE